MFQRNSLNSNEGNIITNNLNNINNNMYNLYPGNIGNMNTIYNNNTIIEKEFEPNIDMKKVLTLADTRTTLMIKNIPNKFTREKLLEIIDKEFKGTYDLFILPKDVNKTGILGILLLIFFLVIIFPIFIMFLMVKNGQIRFYKKFAKLLIVNFKEGMSLYRIILIKLFILIM